MRWGLNKVNDMKRIQFELISRLQECAEMATYVALNINGYPQTEKPIEQLVQDAYKQTTSLRSTLREMVETQKSIVGV